MKSTVKVAIAIAATVKTTLVATVAFCMLGYGDGLFPSV
jgi:hypothetical protein